MVDLLTEECKPTLGAYKRGEAVSNPEMVSRNRRWSEVLVRKVMSGEVVKEFIEENKDVPMPIPSDEGPAEPSHMVNAVESAPAQHVKIEPSVGSGARSSADRPVTGDVQLHDRSDIGDHKRVKRTTGAWNIRLNPSQQTADQPVAIDLCDDSEDERQVDVRDMVPQEAGDVAALEELMQEMPGMEDDADSDVRVGQVLE